MHQQSVTRVRLVSFVAFVLLVAAQGCAVTSPFWGYVPDSTSDPIPFQAWAVNTSNSVVLECADDTSAHGWPTDGEASYIHVANIPVSTSPSLDPSGLAVYSASTSLALPATCWKYFGDYDFWQANLRLSQVNNGSKVIFSSFDAAGLECLGRENGEERSWLGFFDECEKRYLNSDDKIPYIVLRIDGFAAGGDTSPAPVRPRIKAKPVADEKIANLPAVQVIAPISPEVKAQLIEAQNIAK